MRLILSRHLLWLMLGVGLSAGFFANFLWPLLLIDKFGYQCSPPTAIDPQQVCAGGLSYLLPLLSLTAGTLAVVVLMIVAFRLTRVHPVGLRWFVASGSLPLVILIYALTLTRSLGEQTALAPLALSIIGAGGCVLAATLHGSASKVLLGCAAGASVAGIVLEPGASTIFLLMGTIAIVGIFTPVAPSQAPAP